MLFDAKQIGGFQMNHYKLTALPQKKSSAIDPFRMVAAFLIVAIHTAPLSSFSETADFFFSYCFARIAVPFFLMTTGYFVLPSLILKGSASFGSLWKCMKKTMLLYVAATVLYLPINIYSGKLPTLKNLFKVLVFDGTFYHLWYLPAALLGTLLLFLLARKCRPRIMLLICGILYLIGLFGDSWYGISAQLPPVKTFYDVLFRISSYTRNGVFYAPIFLLTGALISCQRIHKRFDEIMVYLTGTLFSLLCMLGEGYLSYASGWQRHNSMYLFLVPCMFFLVHLLLCLPGKSSHSLRQVTLLIYLLHPLVIILIRGFAKVTHLSAYLVENSLIHYLAVCTGSFVMALFLSLLASHTHLPKRK